MSVTVCFDLETTGLSPVRDEIVQIGAVASNRPNSAFQRYLLPNQPVKEKSSAINGIQRHGDTLYVNGGPVKSYRPDKSLIAFMGYLKSVSRFGKYEVLLVAHNGQRFDFPVLVGDMKHWNVFPPSVDVHCYDSKLLAKDRGFGKGQTSQAFLADYYDVDVENEHDAVDDACVLEQIVNHMDEEGANWNEAYLGSLEDLYNA